MTVTVPAIGRPTGTRFALGDDVWAAHLTADGHGYVWVAGGMACGQAFADLPLWPCPARADPATWGESMAARRFYWAAVDGQPGRARHPDLVTAMRAAMAERDRRRWAPRSGATDQQWPASVAEVA